MMKFLKTYAIILYPIAFMLSLYLAYQLVSLLPLFIVMVLMLTTSKLMKQF